MLLAEVENAEKEVLLKLQDHHRRYRKVQWISQVIRGLSGEPLPYSECWLFAQI